MILNKQTKVEKDFENGKHDYFINGEKCISVNELLTRQQLAEKMDGNNKNVKSAGERGTLIHSFIEDYIKNGVITPDDDVIFCINGLVDTFGDLDKGNTMSEISVAHDFNGLKLAGTIDTLIEKNGEYYIVDFKTGNQKEYKERWQLSLYSHLLKEDCGIDVKGLYIINSKTRTIEEKEFIPVKEINTLIDCERNGKGYTDELLTDKMKNLAGERIKVLKNKNALEQKSKDVIKYLNLIESEKVLQDDMKKEMLNEPFSHISNKYGSFTYSESVSVSYDEKKLKDLIYSLGGKESDLESCQKLRTTTRFLFTPSSEMNTYIKGSVRVNKEEKSKGEQR